jgi:hypothetical protein
MAVSRVAAADKNGIRSLEQGLDHELRIDHAGTHHSDQTYILGIDQTRCAGQIRSRVSTPVANKRYNYGFMITHNTFSS